MKETDWAQFRELATGISEDELAAFIRDYAAVHRPATTPDMGEDEFVAILHSYAATFRYRRPNVEPPIPLKTPDLAPVLGALAASPEEWATIRAELALEPKRDPITEHERFEQIMEAIESGAIDRKRPGRPPVVGCPERAQKCLDEADGNVERARETFIEKEMKSRNIERKSAKNDWAKAMKTLFPDR